MKDQKGFLNQDRIIFLLLIFLLATSSLWARYFIRWQSSLFGLIAEKTLFYFGFIGYGFVFALIILHYLIPVIKWLRCDNKHIIIVVAIFLGLGYSLFDGLKEYSLLVFLRDICMAGLLILGYTIIQRISSKRIEKNNKTKNNKRD